MYILVHGGEQTEGAYAVLDKNGNKVLFFFEEQSDAERYAMMLETENDEGSVEPVEVDPDLAIKTCIVKGVNYAVSYTHLRAHETLMNLVCRLLLEKKNH